VVDLEKKKVVQFLDTGVVPISEDGGTDFFAEETVIERPQPKPIVVSQPAGVDFAVNGNEIRWQKWRFRYQMHPREGLVLHTVAFEDDSDLPGQPQVRSILHRASVSEMVVPYGDAAATWNWRSAFDQGEYGLGRTCNSLTLGQDVPANAKLFDVMFASDLGTPGKEGAGRCHL
jgi:primary-amine oxidase